MKNILFLYTLCFVVQFSNGQVKRSISADLLVQYNNTLYDYTRLNNQWGVGIGAQTFFNNRSAFKPFIEFTGEIYPMDDKVYRIDLFGSSNDKINSVVNLLGGLCYQPGDRIYFAVTAGPSFINEQTYVALKPSVGAYFSSNHRWTGKVSFMNVFNRIKAAQQDFGSLSIGLGYKLF